MQPNEPAGQRDRINERIGFAVTGWMPEWAKEL